MNVEYHYDHTTLANSYEDIPRSTNGSQIALLLTEFIEKEGGIISLEISLGLGMLQRMAEYDYFLPVSVLELALPSYSKKKITELEIIDLQAEIEKNQKAIQLLDSWCYEDEAEQKKTWEFLKQALDEDRLSNRKLFP
jgi:hypothetical protein